MTTASQGFASALPYGTHERSLRLAMRIGSSDEVEPQRNRWPDVARDLGPDGENLADRARELAQLAPDAFANAVHAPDVSALRRELPSRLLDLVADRARRCLRMLDRGTPSGGG